MKYGIKGGKQTNSNAPTIAEHYVPKASSVSKGDSRSTSSGSSGVQRSKGGSY